MLLWISHDVAMALTCFCHGVSSDFAMVFNIMANRFHLILGWNSHDVAVDFT